MMSQVLNLSLPPLEFAHIRVEDRRPVLPPSMLSDQNAALVCDCMLKHAVRLAVLLQTIANGCFQFFKRQRLRACELATDDVAIRGARNGYLMELREETEIIRVSQN